jgi:hypothetical protein
VTISRAVYTATAEVSCAKEKVEKKTPKANNNKLGNLRLKVNLMGSPRLIKHIERSVIRDKRHYRIERISVDDRIGLI